MANKKISQLTGATTPLTGTEELAIVQGGQTLKATTQDVADLAGGGLPYLVYTALLTQSGGDNPMSANITTGNLIIGTTYQIVDNGGFDWDFTNVGAPDNNIGTFFVATGTTPNSWGIDGQLDYNTGAPVVTVLENTIGNIVWSRLGDGEYIGTLAGAFTSGKSVGFIGSIPSDSTAAVNNNNFTLDEVNVQTIDSSFNAADSVLDGSFIEIRVYP